MKKELDDIFYSNIYKSGGWNQSYFKHYSKSPCLNVWSIAMNWLSKENMNDISVLDIGCGVGQVAHMLFDLGLPKENYIGFDFSQEAINQAKARVLEWSDRFYVDNVYTTNLYKKNITHVLIFEVLEHINDDLFVLNSIPQGTQIFGSVPNIDSEGHVRIFLNEQEVKNRYQNHLEFEQIIPIKLGKSEIDFIFKATKK